VQHSNAYIIGFAAAVCAVCGFFVAFSAVALKDIQARNVLMDRQKNVLSVAGLISPDDKLSSEQLTALFDESIRAKVIDLETGQENSSIDPESFDQQRASKDPNISKVAPDNPAKVLRLPNQALVYEVLENGEVVTLILPIEGMGLWSTLYGYLALAEDARTIRGVTYYQHGETAGLGGEVDNPNWKAKWVGRKAFDDRGRTKIHVKKGAAGPAESDPYAMDGLAGATLTSRGVTNMLRFWLGDDGFAPFLENYREQKGI